MADDRLVGVLVDYGYVDSRGATYHNGVLQPVQPILVGDQDRVTFTVQTHGQIASELTESLRTTRSRKKINQR